MNKKIIGLMCGLAVVAVATVGFSAWVVGVQQTTTSGLTKVSVDTVTNDTQYLFADMGDQTISIAENKVHNRDNEKKEIIGSESVGVNENALKFSFKTLSVTLGTNATGNYKKIRIELDNSKNSFLNTTENLVGRTPDQGTWTYLAFTAVEIPFLTDTNQTSEYFTSKVDGTGYTTYELITSKINVAGGITLKLNWGTYFDNKSPVEYYNGLYKASDTISTLLTRANKATTELQKMESELEKSENKITFKLSLA